MDLALAPYTAPTGTRRLSLDPPRPMPSLAPKGRQARDLRFFDSWVDHPGVGLTPMSMFAAFRLAEQGYPQRQVDLSEDLIEGDGTLRNLFEHRESVVGNKPLVLTPGDPSPEGQLAASVLSYAFGRLATKAAFLHLLRVNRHGYAAVEIDWDVITIDGRAWIVPVGFSLVPARRFRIGTLNMIPQVRLNELRLYTDYGHPQGDDLVPGKWLILQRPATWLARAGLMRTAAPLAMAKRFSVRDWVILSQRYGIPMPIVKYKQGADDETKAVGRQILEELGNDGGALVEDSLELTIEEGISIDDPMQQALIAFCNAEMAKLINGSTLRNDNADSGGASYGLGSVHDAVAWDEVRGDGEMLSEAITLQICVPFCRYNGIGAEAPRASIIVEPDLGPADMVTLGVKVKNELGIEVSQQQIRQRTGMRAPIDDKDKAPGMVVQAFPVPAGGAPK